MLSCDIGAYGGFVLKTARSTYTYEGQLAEGVFLLACLKVDVCQSIQFVEDDVDIVRADTMADDRDALPLVGAGDGVELSAGYFTLNGV